METQVILTGPLPLPIGTYTTPQFNLDITQWGVWGGSLHDDGSRFDPDTAETLESFDVTNWTPEQFARLREFIRRETSAAGFCVSNTAKLSHGETNGPVVGSSMADRKGIKKRGCPGPHRAAYELWRAGFDLREVYPTSSYYRHKRYFLDNFGVDIDASSREGDQ